MKDSRCPKCGATLSALMAHGLCPNCLMAMNMASQTNLSDAPSDASAKKSPPKPTVEPLSVETISQLFPAFDVIEILGRGGMGVVYKARQRSLDRLVALKILAPERVQDEQFAERFTREAKILASLNHENIVTVYDFGEVDGIYYLTMELIDGVNLRELMRLGEMTPERALAIVPAICQALSFAHDKGVVHRDIKPENLLVDQQGHVKIADFGIAKLLAGVDGELALSHSRVGTKELTSHGRLGTPAYMAPEQESRPGLVDHRADIFSLGVVFYEMLTGDLPSQRFEPPSQKVTIDLRLDEVVLRAMEKQPERRYQTAAELGTEVEGVRDNEDQIEEPDWRTWAPGRSALARQICARMSRVDRRRMWRSDCRDGLLLAVPLVLLYVGFDLFSPETDSLVVVGSMFLLLISFIPWFIHRDRKLLCRTQWARRRGIRPRDLRLVASELGVLGKVIRWWKPAITGLLATGLGLGATIYWLERAQPLGQLIAAETADQMISASAQTWRRMRVFGGDELYYRFRIQGFAGALSEKWIRPVPHGILAEDFVLMSVESLRFDRHGQIVWSEDQKRVSFRVNDVEVDAFNTLDGSHSFQGGFRPQEVVSLGERVDTDGIYLDLDNGSVYAGLPKPTASPQHRPTRVQQIHEHEPFMRESGADIVFRPGIGLTLVDGISLAIGNAALNENSRAFDVTAVADVEQTAVELSRVQSAAKERQFSARETSLVSLAPGNVWVFVTREKSCGLLEVLENSLASEAVSFRYKLVSK